MIFENKKDSVKAVVAFATLDVLIFCPKLANENDKLYIGVF